MTANMKELNEEKYEKALEWLENAVINLDNMKTTGLLLLPLVKEQIQNAIKYLNEESVGEDVMDSIE